MTPQEITQIDTALLVWRQGDIVLGDFLPAIHLADLSTPATPESAQLAAEQIEAGEPLDLMVVSREIPGFMIVSQTCDIVRSCKTREFVELCPLIEVPPEKLGQVQAGYMPRYLWCSGLNGFAFAADLDQVTTVEKRTLVQFNHHRIQGANDDDERRRLASALARKRARAALPDEFVAFITPLQKRIKERHGRNSGEGKFMAAVREIRAVPEPDWTGEAIEVTILFLFNEAGQIPDDAEVHMNFLIGLVAANDKFTIVGRVLTLEQMTAAAYLGSDALDLDALSDN